MTLAQMRTEIAAVLSLDLDDPDELALIDQWINEGVTHIVAEGETKVTKDDALVTAVGDGDYDLDPAILRILWIQTSGDGNQRQLEQVGPTEILRRRLNGTPSNPAQLYAVDGANALLLYPVPSDTQTLTLYYVPRPATLTAGADLPSDIPVEFHRLVVFYALWRGADYDDDQSSAQGARYQQLLEQGIADMRSRINRKRGRRLARAIPGRKRRLPHRNDIYPN